MLPTASCKIKKIYDYEFIHNIPTNHGSSGCPIILLNNNINLILVIGIHKNGNEKEKINGGTFIGEIIKEIINKKKDKKENKNKEDNSIAFSLPPQLFICKSLCRIFAIKKWVMDFLLNFLKEMKIFIA